MVIHGLLNGSLKPRKHPRISQMALNIHICEEMSQGPFDCRIILPLDR